MPSIPRVANRRIVFTSMYGSHDAWRLTDYVGSVLANGVGRYVCQLQRLTIYFDRQDPESSGIREFIREDLVDFAKQNQGVAVYVVPQRKEVPSAVAEYLNGRQASLKIKLFTRKEMQQWINYLRTRSGRRIAAFPHNWRTENPSVQGMWTPFLNQDTKLNLKQWPNEEASRYRAPVPTATEIVLQLAKEAEEKELKKVNN